MNYSFGIVYENLNTMRLYALWGMIFSLAILVTLIVLTVYIHEELTEKVHQWLKKDKDVVKPETPPQLLK